MKAPSDHIRTLQRRVDFLKSREHKNSFDLAELGALEWALVNLPPKPAAPNVTDIDIDRLSVLAGFDPAHKVELGLVRSVVRTILRGENK